MSKKILMVLTSHSTIADDQATGLWLEEYAAPYATFIKNGFDVTVVSIEGGQVPLDPNSLEEETPFEWQEAQAKLSNTAKLSEEHISGFDAVFLPGGHGTVFDFPENDMLKRLLQEHAEHNAVISSVCHGPSGLVNVTYKDGTPLVKGKKVSAFTDDEEREMQLDGVVPFLLETTLKERGAEFVRGDNWTDFSVRDGHLITGQNPMSSQSTADKVVKALKE
ncbi:glutamine amidotransferase [Salipaludibacillus keqinensis]|uniref:Glutamine amidotransferase n=1 Tax=Salipaludibacillus keqinensis TaxID=2045207 RepID=A0A323T8K2_9BACI|nr:type 1 glutamine amidotransferase domain-containing protein [Salipaludibacillus keqinensis]PYZ91640.1 glutamine amidotransferase [Salipaludibacillus keqinensis]